MKKVIRIVLATLIIVMLLAASIHDEVKANGIPTNNPSLAQGDWSAGTNTEVNFDDSPIPNWLQLLASPVNITETGQVCHAFRGGQFGWVGEIRQLVDGKWVKVPATIGWVPNEEGSFTICFDANMAGTYALFGYYNPPKSYYPDYVDPGAPAPSHET